MYFSLSWRNIWRNKKRTLILAASVFFAVLLSIVMRSAQLGSYAYMIHSSAKLLTGYLQVQGKGYWENRSLDKGIHISLQDLERIRRIENVTNVTRRLEAFALVSHLNKTRVGQILGIDPQSETKMTGLRDKVIKGEYLNPNATNLLIGKGLAEILQADIGDSLVIYGQGAYGQMAVALLPVGGIVDLPFETLDNSLVFMVLPAAQEIFSMENRLTSLPIMIDDVRHLDHVYRDVRAIADEHWSIMTWSEMMPDLKENIEVDNVSGMIMLAILYVVIAFGVFGTVMMMVAERTREFGILIAVGMRKGRLILVSFLESILVSFLGAVAGMIASIPIILYLINHPIYISGEGAKIYENMGIEPIMNFSGDPTIFISQALVALAIALITTLYPYLFIRRLEPVKALHG
ncbi:MAG TPA: ABC transporter permease [Calditrichaeota bacterium]|nr:ABC transporter permease [Calditrichota bacterium]